MLTPLLKKKYMNDFLLTEFNKTALEFVDLYAILECYLKEELDYYKKNKNVFQYMESSSLLLFFNKNNFNYKYKVEEKRVINGSNDGTGVKMLQLYIENKDENEVFCIDQAVEGGNRNPEENQISIKYKKTIDNILITKKIYLKRPSYQETIGVFECDTTVFELPENLELVSYSFKYDIFPNAKIDFQQYGSNTFNGVFLDLVKEIERNSGIEESFFDMSDLKYDFKNKNLIEILLKLFSQENIFNDEKKINSMISNYDNNIRGYI